MRKKDPLVVPWDGLGLGRRNRRDVCQEGCCAFGVLTCVTGLVIMVAFYAVAPKSFTAKITDYVSLPSDPADTLRSGGFQKWMTKDADVSSSSKRYVDFRVFNITNCVAVRPSFS